MKQVVATALALLLLLFLLPLLLVRQDGPGTAQEGAVPTGELPIDRTVGHARALRGRSGHGPGLDRGRRGAHAPAGQIPVAGGGR